MKWFRWYRGTVGHPKLAMIAEEANQPTDMGDGERVLGAVSLTDVIAVWCAVLEDAANSDHWGTLKKDARYIAVTLRWSHQEVQQILDSMVRHDMIVATGGIVNWEEYQYSSDHDRTNAERQRRYYNKHKHKPNALAKRPDTDSESDTEKKEEERKAEVRTCAHAGQVNGKGNHRDRGRGKRLPDAWEPDLEDRAYATERGLDPDAIAEQFRDYWLAKAGAGGLKLDWAATWRTWCRREAERLAANGAGGHRPRAGSIAEATLGALAYFERRDRDRG